METFTQTKDFVENPRFISDRKQVLTDLEMEAIDEPIRDIILNMNKLPFCFTLQCCYGHFVWDAHQDAHNFNTLPPYIPGQIRYRIAYMAFCIENNPKGAAFRDALARIPDMDRDYVQFGSAHWFWERHLNSFVLQVEPKRFQDKDEAWVEWEEAQKLEKIRSIFFEKLRVLQPL